MRRHRFAFIIILVIALLVGYGIYHFMYSMSALPKGELVREVVSPNGGYTIRAYLSSPALSRDAVRCEVENNSTQGKRNIFWDYEVSDVLIEWINEETVIINGRELNVNKDFYDYRREQSPIVK